MENIDGFKGKFETSDDLDELLEDLDWQIDPPIDLSEESSGPLGLKLTITQELLDLAQMALSQHASRQDEIMQSLNRKEPKVEHDDEAIPQKSEKCKASNFYAKLLKIGSWVRFEQNEGDVVAKIYFAKRKLVWEILECKLKSKMEIHWSDIAAIKATYGINQCDILEVELSRPPLFFCETGPKPKQHTIWQSTDDFTANQASTHKWHYLEFAEGTLQMHYEKLLSFDHNLNLLSHKPFPTHHSPCFKMDHEMRDLSSNFSMHGTKFLNPYNQPYRNWLPSQIPLIENPQTTSSQLVGAFEHLHQQIGTGNQFPDFGPNTRAMTTNYPSSVIDFAPIVEHTTCAMDPRSLYSLDNLPILEGNAAMNPVLHEQTPLCGQGIQMRSIDGIQHQHQVQGLSPSVCAAPAPNFNPHLVSATQCTSGHVSDHLNINGLQLIEQPMLSNSHTFPSFDEQRVLPKVHSEATCMDSQLLSLEFEHHPSTNSEQLRTREDSDSLIWIFENLPDLYTYKKSP